MKHNEVLSLYQDEAYDVVYLIGLSFGKKGFGTQYLLEGVYFSLPSSGDPIQKIVTHEDFEKINEIFTEEPYASQFRKLRDEQGKEKTEYEELVQKAVQAFFPKYPTK